MDDFSSGLAGWTTQSQRSGSFTEIVTHQGGAPVIEIVAQGNGPTGGSDPPPWTILTSDAVGSVGDFDIAVSFAGSDGMNGGNSFGLIFGFQDASNFYMAHVFPGFSGSALRVEKVSSNVPGEAYSGSTSNQNVGFTWATDNLNSVRPDALRVVRSGNAFQVFAAAESASGWLTISSAQWTDNAAPSTGLVGFGERYDGTRKIPGARFGVFGEGSGVAKVLQSTDLSLQNSLFSTPIPEPSTWGMFMICVACVLIRWRPTTSARDAEGSQFGSHGATKPQSR